MRTPSAAAVLFSVLCLPACSDHPAAPPARQLVVARAQPSVLQVITSVDVTFSRPADLGLLGPVGRKVGWQDVAADPARCLKMSGRPVAVAVEDQPFCTGSAFAIDGAGTLLTNQHVIDCSELQQDSQATAAFALDDALGLVPQLVKLLGGPPPESLGPQLDQNLLPWLLANYRCTDVRRHAVRLATHLVPGTVPVRVLRLKPVPPAPDWQKSTVVCEVLATGEVYPGKDIAVLRAGTLAGKLISLPLGRSRDVVLGSNVFALGFPGAAVIDGVDADAARFRVIAHDGIVDQKLPLTTGWEAFHMTANINHGDSGGPVVDDRGEVIAINVAGSNVAAAQNLAIPIDLAREALAAAKIMLALPNAVTQKWRQACEALAKGRHAEALPLFEEVDRLQTGFLLAGRTGSGQAGDMIQLCRRELGIATGGLVPGRPVPAAAEDWLSATWGFVCRMPLYQQAMLGFVLLSALVGVLRFVTGLFARRRAA